MDTNIPTLFGQWIGRITGTNQANIVLNVDRDRPTLGWLQVNDPTQPFAADVTFVQNGLNITGNVMNFDTHSYGTNTDITIPRTCSLTATLNGQKLEGTWTTDVPTEGKFALARFKNSSVSSANDVMEWQKFRNWVLTEKNNNPSLIFRGHTDGRHGLITSLHRTGRRNLMRYEKEDIPWLCRQIEATLGTSYDLQNPLDHAELLYLAQHHGYPTPLLDWTESPFIAAYFAFAKLTEPQIRDGHNVRIFMFNQKNWPYGQVKHIAEIEPRFAPMYPRARANPRALPQQSVAMFSNMVEIETFITLAEKQADLQFLHRIDMPAAERNIAMRELATMGLTAATLFPGLDGVCGALTEKFFF